MRQEQEEAQPEVTEVAPGILRAQIPINFTGLGHVNMYLRHVWHTAMKSHTSSSAVIGSALK